MSTLPILRRGLQQEMALRQSEGGKDGARAIILDQRQRPMHELWKPVPVPLNSATTLRRSMSSALMFCGIVRLPQFPRSLLDGFLECIFVCFSLFGRAASASPPFRRDGSAAQTGKA